MNLMNHINLGSNIRKLHILGDSHKFGISCKFDEEHKFVNLLNNNKFDE